MGVLRELFENRGDYMDGTIVDPDTGEVFHFDSLLGDDSTDDDPVVQYAKPFDEKLHPRGKAGKFARKGTAKPAPGQPTVNGEQIEPVDPSSFGQWFGKSKVVDANGKPLRVYHGTQRPDRIGNTFDPARATSGPMAFFTDDPAIASNYSENKGDTSLEQPSDYGEWFKVKTPSGEYDVDKVWWHLTRQQREEIARLLPHVTDSDADGNETDELRNGGPTEWGLSGGDHWAHEIKQARGNVLEAAKEIWLNGGTLIGSEASFLQVLEKGGLKDVALHDPNAAYSAVFPVYLSIQNPLDSTNVPADVVKALHKAGKAHLDDEVQTYGSDLWDKRTRTAGAWLTAFDESLTDPHSYAWTSIPDWVTDVLKSKGYDGIHDQGGKGGAGDHQVWIPFSSNQVKSATGNSGEWSKTDNRIDHARDMAEKIRHALQD